MAHSKPLAKQAKKNARVGRTADGQNATGSRVQRRKEMAAEGTVQNSQAVPPAEDVCGSRPYRLSNRAYPAFQGLSEEEIAVGAKVILLVGDSL